jgi:hypothetical protein
VRADGCFSAVTAAFGLGLQNAFEGLSPASLPPGQFVRGRL